MKLPRSVELITGELITWSVADIDRKEEYCSFPPEGRGRHEKLDGETREREKKNYC